MHLSSVKPQPAQGHPAAIQGSRALPCRCVCLTLIAPLRHFVPSWRGHTLRERLAGHSRCPPHPQHRPAAPAALPRPGRSCPPPPLSSQAAEEEGSAALLCPRGVVFLPKRASTTAKLLFFMSHLMFIVSQSRGTGAAPLQLLGRAGPSRSEFLLELCIHLRGQLSAAEGQHQSLLPGTRGRTQGRVRAV